jgi:hypothetical protein
MTSDGSLLELALSMARSAHAGQTDKAGRAYIEHIERVVAATSSPDAKVAAALHDIVEDTDTTLADLEAAGFPPEVVAAVDALTRRGDEPYLRFIWRAATNALAREVKMADLLDNGSPARLAELPSEQADRLRDKYSQAIRFLEAIDSSADGHGAVYLVGGRSSSRAVWGEYDKFGHLKMTGQSLSAGGGEYEWSLLVEPDSFPRLRKLLSGRKADDVLMLLLDRCATLPDGGAFDPISWLNKRGVGRFSNWVS